MAGSAGTIQVRLVANSKAFNAGLAAAGTKLAGFGKSATRTGATLTKGLTLPILAIGGLSVKAAVDFESAFAGVRKTVDATEAEFEMLEKGIRNMAKELPASHEEIARVAEVAGQLGIETDNILEFTRTMIDLGETTNLSAEEAATALARLANVLGTDQKQFDNLGSSVVDLGNNFETTEAEIVEMAQRLAAAGKIAGLTEGDVLGIATALTSVGVQAQAGGTAFSKVLQKMGQAVAEGGEELETFAKTAGLSAEEFADAFAKDPSAALTKFVEGLGDIIESGGNAYEVLDELSLADQRLMRAVLSLAGAGDLLNEALDTGNEAFEENTALTEEAQKRYETAAAQWDVFKNKIRDVAITIGFALLPILNQLLDDLDPLLDKIADLAEEFEDLPGPIQSAIGGFILFLAVVGPVTWVIGKIALAIKGTIGFFSALGTAAAAVASPIGAIVAAVASVIATAAILWAKWDEVWNAISNHPAYAVIASVVALAFAPVQLAVFLVILAIRELGGVWDWIAEKSQRAAGIIRDASAAFDFVKRKIMEAMRAGREAVVSGLGTIVSFFAGLPGRIGGAIGNLPGQLYNLGRRALNLMKQGVAAGAGAVVNYVASIPGRIVSQIAGLPGRLYRMGREAVEALARGIRSVSVPKIDLPGPFSAPGIPGLQHGGPVMRGRPYLVGEAGPELFVPSASGRIVPSASAGGRGGTTVVVNVAGSVVSERDLIDTIHRGLLAKRRNGPPLGLN